MNSLLLFILCLSALCYLWFSSYQLMFSVPPSSLLAMIVAFVGYIYISTKRKNSLNKEGKMLIFISFVFLFWAGAVYFANNIFTNGILRLLQITLGIGIALITGYLLDSPKKMNYFIFFLLFGIVISAIVGIGQYFFKEPFIKIWLATGQIPETAMISVLSGRIAGLSTYSIPFSRHLGSILPLTFSLYLFEKKNLRKSQKIAVSR